MLLHATFFKASNFPVSTECMNWSHFKGRNKTMKDPWSLRQSWMRLTGKVDEASPQHCNKQQTLEPRPRPLPLPPQMQTSGQLPHSTVKSWLLVNGWVCSGEVFGTGPAVECWVLFKQPQPTLPPQGEEWVKMTRVEARALEGGAGGHQGQALPGPLQHNRMPHWIRRCSSAQE